MFGWLFGRKKKAQNEAADDLPPPDPAEVAADEAFDEAKQAALEKALGPMDDMVLHAVIPFFIGGGLDLYMFSACIPGTVYATQELIVRHPEDRPKAGRDGHFELVACTPPGVPSDNQDALSLVQSLLNPIARYASMAALSPRETAEIPGEKRKQSLGVIFDRFEPKGHGLDFNDESFHLLLCMAIHPSELAFARAKGGAALIEKLQAAGVYPYSNLKRPAVV